MGCESIFFGSQNGRCRTVGLRDDPNAGFFVGLKTVGRKYPSAMLDGIEISLPIFWAKHPPVARLVPKNQVKWIAAKFLEAVACPASDRESTYRKQRHSTTCGLHRNCVAGLLYCSHGFPFHEKLSGPRSQGQSASRTAPTVSSVRMEKIIKWTNAGRYRLGEPEITRQGKKNVLTRSVSLGRERFPVSRPVARLPQWRCRSRQWRRRASLADSRDRS